MTSYSPNGVDPNSSYRGLPEDDERVIENLKRTERRLRQSEAYLAEAQRLSHTGTWAFNKTKTLYWSDEGYRLWGLDPLQGLPTRETIWQRIHPDDRDRVYEGVQEAIREKRDYTVEFRIVLPDGTVKYLQSCNRHLFSERGELVEVLGTHIDVTERKRAEEALRESEYKLRQIIDTVPGFLWSADPAGEPTHINQHMLDYSGMRFEDFRHGGWEAFVHPDDFPETARALYHAIQTGTSYQAVNRLRRADGEFRWHHTRGEPLRDQQGHIIQWYGLSVDIDDGKKAFAAQLQAILNVLPAYTWYAAPSGGLTFVNKRTADYLGVPKDHPLRFGIDTGAQWDDWISLLHPDDHEEARKYWSNLLRTGEGGEHSYRVRNAQGDYRWFLTRVEPLRASDGTLLLWIGATLDIEELKCAEQALRESEYKLREIIETVPGLIWSADPAGEPTQFNQRILDYSGMRLEDFQHGGWEAFLHPADFAETAKAFHHAIQTGTSYQAVHRLRRAADGVYRWHHARGEPLRDRQGRIIQWYGLSVDIDEAKRAEDRLRRSEAHLAEAQRLSHTGSAVYNETGILYWSEEASRIWGFDPLQGIPSREAVWQRIHPDDLDRVNEEIERGLREKRSFTNAFRFILADGMVKHIE